ncbi:hypothetical protein KL905_004306 [Ogataea polymorpha]|nr:hypothetical protein KL908_002165 [Ogataea polymorpha]KAG7897987.1 hypothetical protein KL935_004540 [Ogataea polymorpha]KAG7900585.1 hypothetical protein KL907_004703 [Ogataea polymorpha]KAG7906152.1 hypothetical protein KL906_004605 [Ogataea polymorpha]KAG7914088.1 hypothetical protein KL927_004739 [Ogataea polymorpha]
MICVRHLRVMHIPSHACKKGHPLPCPGGRRIGYASNNKIGFFDVHRNIPKRGNVKSELASPSEVLPFRVEQKKLHGDLPLIMWLFLSARSTVAATQTSPNPPQMLSALLVSEIVFRTLQPYDYRRSSLIFEKGRI